MEVYFLQRKWFLNILKCLISPQIPRNGEAKWRGERAGLTLGMTALMNTSYSPSYLWNRDDFTNDSISWPQRQCLQNNYGKYMTCLCLKFKILCHLSLYHPSGHISFFNLPGILRFGCTSHQSFFFFNYSRHFALPCLLYLVFLQLGKLFQVWKSFFHSLSPH